MAYLDLDELPRAFDGGLLWSARRPALAWFRRADHLGEGDLAEAVRALVAERTGRRPQGPVRLLTHLRYFGHCFNPVSFYYCFEGERVEAVVAHVTNTPWGESHSYVLDARDPRPGRAWQLPEGAPRLAPDGHGADLRLALTEPGERLSVHISSTGERGTVFDATLSLARRELSPGALRGRSRAIRS